MKTQRPTSRATKRTEEEEKGGCDHWGDRGVNNKWERATWIPGTFWAENHGRQGPDRKTVVKPGAMGLEREPEHREEATRSSGRGGGLRGRQALPTLESRKAECAVQRLQRLAASQIWWWEAALGSGPTGDNVCFKKMKCGPFRMKTEGQVEATVEERGNEVLSWGLQGGAFPVAAVTNYPT